MKIFMILPLAAAVIFCSCSAKNNNAQQKGQEKADINAVQTENADTHSKIKGSLDKDGKIVIKNLNYEKGSAELPEESEESVKALTTYLTENTTVTMNVACYTDNDGTPAYCIDLSKKRARDLSEKFKKLGIREDRINFSGEGWKPGNTPEQTGERIEIELVH